MNNLWSSKGLEEPPNPDRPTGDVADTGDVAVTAVAGDDQGQPPLAPAFAPAPSPSTSSSSQTTDPTARSNPSTAPSQPSPALPLRPGLQRNAMQAVPSGPAPMPPTATRTLAAKQQQQQAPGQQATQNAPPDSLSLQQVKRIVDEMNRPEPIAYDFVYEDMGPHAAELDEWFGYQFWQWVRLDTAQKAFDWYWEHETGGKTGWDDADSEARTRFVMAAIAGVESNDAALRAASIGKLAYLVLGRWVDTAVPSETSAAAAAAPTTDAAVESVASAPQLQAIKAGVECLASLGCLPVVWEALRSTFEVQWSANTPQAATQDSQDSLIHLMTIMYVVIQETLNDLDDMASTYKRLLDLEPTLVDFMLTATSKLRWDEQSAMPQTQIFLLFWKSILLVFGGTGDIDRLKRATGEKDAGSMKKDTITASPLDYHVFRQEITSKYPAYVPPRPAIPLEAENTSLLPPLPNHASRTSGANGIVPGPTNATGGASILHQPVHIATPAPSPPPSPAVGGKGGKKQNYQTNQNFPFMYPPLDATSNSAGGKGLAGIHDAVVSRRWEGSDIPASILEAGQLFSTRVRMTRATRQLWDERERFLKSERGWDDEDSEDEIEDLDLDELTLEEREMIKELKAEDKDKKPKPRAPGTIEQEVDFGPRPGELDERDRRRLLAVEHFYGEALPHLQSLVIVLLRPIVANATAMAAQQPGGQAGPGMAGRAGNPPVTPGVNGAPGGPRSAEAQEHGGPDPNELQPEEVDAARTREITAKAMTGILLLLLKWLRLSHVLKFEYLTQLLLDSNYVLLVLKLFAHQDIQQVVDSKMDRIDNSFFQFCSLRWQHKNQAAPEANETGQADDTNPPEEVGEGPEPGPEPELEEESEDDAAPPPIRREARPQPQPGKEPPEQGYEDPEEDEQSRMPEPQGPTRPEVDELGYPINPLPMEPITDFSRRNFFSLINYLRIMQKVCKSKAHRNLLLVQYKSSTILRKSLRVPQPELRLYTLKLFKNQVPYCGRKWRQSNMRVITAVYLHCRPELRDEWLAGSDVDAEVDAALPLEQALRGLTHWFNVRRHPDKMAADIRSAMKEERVDFFARELGKMEMIGGQGDGGDDGLSELDIEGWA